MKKENTAIRLKKIMSDKGLRQVDILNKTLPYCEKYDVKMNKSDISQYCSGKTEPNQDKLFVLGRALDVNEAWLMGYDVPMERKPIASASIDLYNVHCETEDESKLILSYRSLSGIGKKKVSSYAGKLLEIETAESEVVAAHERTGIEVSDEMRKYDDDIMDKDNF